MRRLNFDFTLSTTRSSLQSENGQALVEFALVLPLLALLLVSMLHFGKVFNYWNDATHLTAEGARFAVVNRKPEPTSALSLQQQLRAQADTAELRNGGTPSVVNPAQVCVDFPTGNATAGEPVRVRMSFTYSWLPIIGASIGVAQTTVTASAVMRLETPPTNFAAGCT